MRRHPLVKLVGLAGIALLLAFVENWLLWGYVISRPTLAAELDQAEELKGFSVLDLGDDIAAAGEAERVRRIGDLKADCLPKRSNECREGWLIVRVEGRRGDVNKIPDVPSRLLDATWQELKASGWFPRVRSARYATSGKPVAGVAIHFQRAGSEYLVFAYRTREIADDYHAYSEALFHLAGHRPTLIRQVHFFLDIAGLEGLDWSILWPINLVILLLVWALTPIDRIRDRIRIRHGKIPVHPRPPQGATRPE